MRHVLVRWGEIGTKSRRVANRMLDRLRQRVQDRLEYEDLDVASVHRSRGRIVVRTAQPVDAATAIAEIPGVVSTSPAVRVDPDISEIEAATDRFDIGDSFGVDTNRAGDRPFTSEDVNERVGAHVQERTGAEVDLEDPDTWIEVDVREDDAYVFTERYEGPGGYPIGSQDPLAALISGGIDSPVAAHSVMTRGTDIVPVYFFNKPIAAGDHLGRFEAALAELRRFHPGKDWCYYVVDMEAVNEALMEIGRGRMLLHRMVMFRTAERLAERERLRGIVTGESIGQKSSQTTANLDHTTREVSIPVHRPLLAMPKDEITERAREIGTFESAKINSACRSLAPEQPATSMAPDELEELKQEVGFETLVDRAWGNLERSEL